MNSLEFAKAKYEELIARMESDIEQAEAYKEDMVARYSKRMELADAVTAQSMVLKIQDYITQKYNAKVEIERQYMDILNEIAKAE